MVLALGTLGGCESSKQRAEKHLASALDLLKQGDFVRASVEFRNVFKLDPTNREARLAFAAELAKRGAEPQAYAQYSQVVDQNPDDIEALTAASRTAAEIGNWSEARRRVTAALAIAPQDPALLAVKAAADYAEAVSAKDTGAQSAAAAAARALMAQRPEDLILYQVVIDAAMRAQDYSAASSEIDKAIAIAPANKGFYMLRLQVALALQDNAEVETQLKQLVQLFPDDPAMGATLLRWYVSRKELDKAEAYLRATATTNAVRLDLVSFLTRFRGADAALKELDTILAAMPQDAPAADAANPKSGPGGRVAQVATRSTFRALRASIRFEKGERDAAIAEMQDILATAPPSDETRRVKVALARMQFATGNAVAAQALVEEVLSEDATQIDAVKLKAGWLIDDDKGDDAVALLRTALDANPRDAQVMTLLARAYERLGNRDLMGDMLSQATDASNRAPDESLRYATYLIGNDQLLPAEGVLVDALRLDPGNVAILRGLGEIYVRQKDWGRGNSVADRLEQIGSDDAKASGRALHTRILQGQQKNDEAVGYLQSLTRDGTAGIGAQAEIVRSLLANNEAAKAQTYIADLLARSPDDPALRFIDASVRSATGDNAAADATFRDLVREDPKRLPAWIALIRHLSLQGLDDQARAALDEALKALPDAGDLLLIKAGYLERDRDIPGAIAIYETLYARDSSNPLVANNLASLLAGDESQDPDKLQRAYSIAQRLRGTTVPAFADTYGWITQRRGGSEEALPYLETAAKGLPEDPSVQYHLAEAYRALGRPDDARTQYAKVVAIAAPDDARAFVAKARDLATGDPQPDPPKN